MKRRLGSAVPTLPATALALVLAVIVGACAAPPATTPPSTTPSEPMSDPPDATASRTPVPMTESPTATATEPAATSASPAPTPTDELLALELTDVRTGQAFTLAELAASEGPVLLEPMAIWCSSCRAQQREVVRAHELGEFSSVSLDVELNEDPDDLAAYAEREGFDWRFAMADPALYRLLQQRFDTAVVVPPATPLIVIDRDGTIRALEFGAGIRSAEQLIDELDAG